MPRAILRSLAFGLALLSLAACAKIETGPPGVPSRTEINPITGSRPGGN